MIIHFKVTELDYVVKLFNPEGVVEGNPAGTTFSNELKELVVRSCHVSLVYLGDLSRYRELHIANKSGKKDWGPACGYYQQARKLLPSAGSPMNQLAVVAIYAENILASTYFFLRAVCAAEEFPTARDNLALGYKKILSREKKSTLVEAFVRLHAGMSLKPIYDKAPMDLSEVVTLLKSALNERSITSEVLRQMVCVNIGATYVANKLGTASEAADSIERRKKLYTSLNTDFIMVLLDILSSEASASAKATSKAGATVSAVLRSILPALRVYSRWLRLNLLEAKPVWQRYIRTLTMCANSFPRNELPPMQYALEEDVDLRGYSPLDGGLDGSPLSQTPTGEHPTAESMIRIGTLLSDAADIARRINLELSSSPNRQDVPHPSNNAEPGQSSPSQAPSLFQAQERKAAGSTKGHNRLEQETTASHASDPSMAFSLNQMVDSLVDGHGEEEIVFKGRRQVSSKENELSMTPATEATTESMSNWKHDSPLPRPLPLWTSSVPAPTPNQGR